VCVLGYITGAFGPSNTRISSSFYWHFQHRFYSRFQGWCRLIVDRAMTLTLPMYILLAQAAGMSTSTTEQAKPGMSQGYVVHPDVLHAAKDVLSSVVGSAMCVYSGQPFDTLKVRMFATLWGGGGRPNRPARH
jgi:hypothetical protein